MFNLSFALYIIAAVLHCALALRDALHVSAAAVALPAFFPKRVALGLLAGLPEICLSAVYVCLGVAPHL